jgi:DNA-binding NarL/FixJ family response regulator
VRNAALRTRDQERAEQSARTNKWGARNLDEIFNGQIAVLLVASRLLIRECIARILTPEDFCILASVSNIGELPSSVWHHDSLLLIIDARDDMEAAIRQIRQFKSRLPTGRVVVIGDHCPPNQMVSALRAGANVYLSDSENLEVFI